MREIKFRVWDKADREMYYFPNPKWEAIYFDGKPWSHPKQIPSEFTGLKDDADKDIYEGDIVRYKLTLDSFLQTGEVKFSRGCFGVDKYLLWDLDYMEVIGNVFENPELLK